MNRVLEQLGEPHTDSFVARGGRRIL